MGYISARIPYNSHFFDHEGKTHCSYCNAIIQPDNGTDDYEIVETYYHCDCEEAKRDIEVQKALKAEDKLYHKLIQEEEEQHIQRLEKIYDMMPRPHYMEVKKITRVIEKINV